VFSSTQQAEKDGMRVRSARTPCATRVGIRTAGPRSRGWNSTSDLPHTDPRYDFDHAFATALKGSDNIISFHTKRFVHLSSTRFVCRTHLRYSPRPLIIQGAGAGADVTAMGCTVGLFHLDRG